MRKYLRALALIFGVVWAAFILFEEGQTWDEWEHVHAAWLMGRQGLWPMRGFFEHHLPLIWDALRVYYWLPGPWPDAGVLFFGRLLVMACLFVTAWLASRVAAAQTGRAPRLAPLVVSAAVLSMSSVHFIGTWVIRPETLALPLVFGAYYFWSQKAVRRSGIGIGICTGLLAVSSPRFFPLLGLIAFFPRATTSSPFSRLAVGAPLAAITAAGYWWAAWYPADYFRLAMDLSREIVGVGQPGWIAAVNELWPRFGATWVGAMAISTGLTVLAARSSGAGRERWAWIALNFSGIALAVLTVPLSGLVFLPHNWSMWLAWLVLISAFWAYRWPVPPARFLPAVAAIAGTSIIVMIAVLIVALIGSFRRGMDLPQQIRDRALTAHCLKPEDTVLMNMPWHPTFVRDTGYYGLMLIWNDGRHEKICELSPKYYRDARRPVCDHISELRQGAPAMIDSVVVQYFDQMTGPDGDQDRRALREKYAQISPMIWLRRDRIPCN